MECEALPFALLQHSVFTGFATAAPERGPAGESKLPRHRDCV